MTDKPVTVTEADEAKARALLKPYMERRWSGFELFDAIALVLAETRERAEGPHRRTCEQLFETQARIAELEAELTVQNDRWIGCVAKLEAKNARLRDRLEAANDELQGRGGMSWQEATS